jgi:hypothetical protein
MTQARKGRTTMIDRKRGIGLVALALLALWPTSHAAAAQTFRFQAEWRQDPTTECGPQKVISLVSFQADPSTVSFTYFNIANTCTGEGFQFVTGVGTVQVSGNLNHLFVEGDISGSNGSPIAIDLTLRKVATLPDTPKGEKAVSATAEGEIVLDGQDITGGQPSTSASITRSKS